jgi:hypothetical protein
MSIKIKQQKLLKPEDLKKKPKKTKKLKTQDSNVKNISHKPALNTMHKEKKQNTKSIKLLGFIVFLALIYFISPKPQLLTYEKMGLINKSIYWPGFYKFKPFILDSNLRANANIQANNLFLCHENIATLPCQKYKIINTEGPIAVAMFLYKEQI